MYVVSEFVIYIVPLLEQLNWGWANKLKPCSVRLLVTNFTETLHVMPWMGSPSSKYNVLFQQKYDAVTQDTLGHSTAIFNIKPFYYGHLL